MKLSLVSRSTRGSEKHRDNAARLGVESGGDIICDLNDSIVQWEPSEDSPVKGSSRSRLQIVSMETHVQQLQFITFQNPSEMKDRRNKTLAHVHSVKENSRKLRFKSRQRLQNFRVFTGGSSLRKVVPDGSELKSYADCVQKPLKTLTAALDLWIDTPSDNESDPIVPTSSTSRSSPSITSPKSILSASRGDPFESLPVNSTRVEFLVNSRKSNTTEKPKYPLLSAYSIKDAVRPAIEPLFSIDDEGPRSLSTVFPGVFRLGFSDPAFFHALLFSITFTLCVGQMTPECLKYQGEAIRYLNERMQCPQRALSEACIGTIMILTGVEYRMGNSETHAMHMQGLNHMLNLRDESGKPLSEGLKRALFWHDLNGAVMSGSPRIFTHSTFPSLHWSRDELPIFIYPLPAGFLAHAPLLPTPFLSIVEEIEALRTSIDVSTPYATPCPSVSQIDNIQASIESRLFFLQPATQALGPIAECTRLATYICTYELFTEVWNNTTIPMRLSTYLKTLLLETCLEPLWEPAPDLLLWALFIGGTFADEIGKGEYVRMLRYCRLNGSLGAWWESWEETLKILKSFLWLERVFSEPCMALWGMVDESAGHP